MNSWISSASECVGWLSSLKRSSTWSSCWALDFLRQLQPWMDLPRNCRRVAGYPAPSAFPELQTPAMLGSVESAGFSGWSVETVIEIAWGSRTLLAAAPPASSAPTLSSELLVVSVVLLPQSHQHQTTDQTAPRCALTAPDAASSTLSTSQKAGQHMSSTCFYIEIYKIKIIGFKN